MSRYIDADALEEVKDVMYDIFGNGMYAVRMSDVRELPTADVVDVKHGRWIDTGSGQECSICKEIQYGYDSTRNYCANCGAKMLD